MQRTKKLDRSERQSRETEREEGEHIEKRQIAEEETRRRGGKNIFIFYLNKIESLQLQSFFIDSNFIIT